MKKLFTILAFVAIAQMSFAQYEDEMPAKKEAAVLQKTVEKNEAATHDAKKGLKASTWIKYAKSLCDLYEGVTAATLMDNSKAIVLKYLDVDAPTEFTIVNLDSGAYEKGNANHCDFYFSGDRYAFYTYLDETVLDNALKAYQKAYSLDQGKGVSADVTEGIKKIAQYYTYEGRNAHILKKFAYAGDIFDKVVDMTAAAPVNAPDTIALANACISYYTAKDYEGTIKICKKCLEYGFHGEDFAILQYMSLSYAALGKDQESKEILESCYAEHPESKNIIFLLIDTYTRLGENPEKLLDLLDQAIAKDPSIENLYCIKGSVNEKLGRYDAAIENYREAQKLNAPDARGLACEGQLYYNLAAKTDSEASQLDYKEYKKYDELKAITNDYLKKAASAFEACYEKTADEGLKASVANCLKSVFFYLRNQSDEYMSKYEKYRKVVDGE